MIQFSENRLFLLILVAYVRCIVNIDQNISDFSDKQELESLMDFIIDTLNHVISLS